MEYTLFDFDSLDLLEVDAISMDNSGRSLGWSTDRGLTRSTSERLQCLQVKTMPVDISQRSPHLSHENFEPADMVRSTTNAIEHHTPRVEKTRPGEEANLDETPNAEPKFAEAMEVKKEDMMLVKALMEGAKSAIPRKLTVSVVRLNGEAILHRVEVGADEQVGVLMPMVADALGSNEQVWQMVANTGELLMQAYIEKSGVGSGDTITALTKPRLKVVPGEITNVHAGAELTADGRVRVWGHPRYGGDCSKVQGQLARDVQSIYATEQAFAALKQDGGVVTWGRPDWGGDCSIVQDQLNRDVVSIYASSCAFVATKADGSMICTSGYSMCDDAM
eukprot:gnl/MRDRNA2_/MRDRNA2_62885_c0_seq1.p1 gnl/MRDRNA2_/MRDRNA2_62885_c0~~gnl/MRDRNA2_/MRDRNA2_62885_c0_seq1.p1  ORF type:complete len:334 (+),score=68.02 gnl/MRDRNA2_/MRDRNA2_62885_c0_seq1:137-1138(+)